MFEDDYDDREAFGDSTLNDRVASRGHETENRYEKKPTLPGIVPDYKRRDSLVRQLGDMKPDDTRSQRKSSFRNGQVSNPNLYRDLVTS